MSAKEKLAISILNQKAAALARDYNLVGNVVAGTGATHVPLMIVGLAPGWLEDQCGEPFVGPSGELLNELLSDAGILRQEAYITNLIKVRLPGNRSPLAGEVREFTELLIEEISIVKPTIILTLGVSASRAITAGFTNMADEHGASRKVELDGQSYDVISTYHPSAVLRNSNIRPLVIKDLRLLRSQVDASVAKLGTVSSDECEHRGTGNFCVDCGAPISLRSAISNPDVTDDKITSKFVASIKSTHKLLGIKGLVTFAVLALMLSIGLPVAAIARGGSPEATCTDPASASMMLGCWKGARLAGTIGLAYADGILVEDNSLSLKKFWSTSFGQETWQYLLKSCRIPEIWDGEDFSELTASNGEEFRLGCEAGLETVSYVISDFERLEIMLAIILFEDQFGLQATERRFPTDPVVLEAHQLSASAISSQEEQTEFSQCFDDLAWAMGVLIS
ncbi:MAG: uracil-DNA glycosylase, partial [Promicromonosporaceae bacterium]|nr:uracil-DNA glycosylase [Promicromonosporaceae bacterium]